MREIKCWNVYPELKDFSAYALRNRSDLDQHIKHYWIGKTFKNIFIMLETFAYMAYSLSVFKELFNAGC